MGRDQAVGRAAIIALALSVNTAAAFAQTDGAVRGRVVASADDSAVADAFVTLAHGPTESAQIRTEATGAFLFANVRPGEYILSVSSEGFGTRELRFILEPREVRTLTVALEVSPIAESVSVTGDLAALASTFSPSSTTLTTERLELMPVFQRVTLTDAVVTLAPGMIRGHDDFVHIRGHEVALNPLINGVSFWENTHALFSAGLSPDVIDTANVMTGGFPAEYGNRFGGVVDIVTRSGLRMDHRGAATLSAGDAGRLRVGGELGGRRGAFGYFAFGSWSDSNRFLSPPDPVAVHDEGQGAHGFVQLESGAGRAGSLRVVGIADGTNFQIPKTTRDAELRPLAAALQENRLQSAIVGWTKAAGSLAVTASFYERSSRAQLFPAGGPLAAQAEFDRRLVTIGGKAEVARFAGRHALKAGVDAVRLRPSEVLAYDYSGYLLFTHLVGLPHIHVVGNTITYDGDAGGGQISGYIQDGVQIGSRVTADIGLRVDRYDLLVSTTHASPRLNVAVRVGDRAVVHTSYNHFFVPPAVEGILSSSAGLTQSLEEIGVPLPPLEATVEDQLEGGLAAQAGPLQLAVTTYYRETDNPVHTTVWPDARVYSYASFERARAYGVEAKVDLRPGLSTGLTGYLNYALGHVTFWNPITGGFTTEAEHISATNSFSAPMDQRHTLTAGATYRHAGTGLSVGSTVEYGSGTPMGHGGAGHSHAAGEPAHADVVSSGGPPRVPGHFTIGISVGAALLRDANHRPILTLQFDVENVANDIYLIAQEGEFSPAQYSIPRLLALTARIVF